MRADREASPPTGLTRQQATEALALYANQFKSPLVLILIVLTLAYVAAAEVSKKYFYRRST